MAEAVLTGVGSLQATAQGNPQATLTGVGSLQAIAQGHPHITMTGIGSFRASATAIDPTPNEEVLVCDTNLDGASVGGGSFPRTWNGL